MMSAATPSSTAAIRPRPSTASPTMECGSRRRTAARSARSRGSAIRAERHTAVYRIEPAFLDGIRRTDRKGGQGPRPRFHNFISKPRGAIERERGFIRDSPDAGSQRSAVRRFGARGKARRARTSRRGRAGPSFRRLRPAFVSVRRSRSFMGRISPVGLHRWLLAVLMPGAAATVAAARRSAAGSRRTASSARQPRPSGRRHNGRGSRPSRRS